MNSGIPGKAAMSYILSGVFQIVAYQNYAMDSRLRGNDVCSLAVILAKAGIYCKTIQHLYFALYTT